LHIRHAPGLRRFCTRSCFVAQRESSAAER
jgi:hypothetical protein